MEQYIADQTRNRETKNSIIRSINIALIVVIAILAIILISMSFLWTPMTVSGSSMEPTFKDGTKIVLIRVGYTIKKHDIIIFQREDEDRKVIKRVIATEGDVVQYNLAEKAFYVNGKKLEEKYIKESHKDIYLEDTKFEIYTKLISNDGLKVGENELFVLGDNRNISNDSHIYGCINVDQIIGKYLFRYSGGK